MSESLERLTGVIHWLAFLCACLLLLWHFTIDQSADITWIVVGMALKCPSWEKFKKNKKYRMWAKKSIPDFCTPQTSTPAIPTLSCVGSNFKVKMLYLNSNWDPNIDKQILEFWFDYFEDAGVEDIDFDIETESSNANANPKP